jgi:hypothetical protein
MIYISYYIIYSRSIIAVRKQQFSVSRDEMRQGAAGRAMGEAAQL